MTSDPTPSPDAELSLRAWSPARRALAMAAQWLAFAVLAAVGILALLDLLEGGGRIATRAVIRWVFGGALLPLGVAAVLRRLSLARARRVGETLIFEQRGDRYELPLSSIAQLAPWWLPLPEPAASVVLRSSARLERALSLPEATTLLPDAISPQARARIAFASARARWHRRGPLPLLLKGVLFPLAIAAVVFRSYQVITYGGPLWEARAFGWGRYLAGLGAFGLAGIAYLALIAFALRAVAELLCFGAALLSPRAASGIRRGAEIAVRVLYYGAIPALLAARFFA